MTTTSAFLTVEQNLPRMQQMTANEPAVKTASAYYEANIGKVSSISELVNNYRLLSYALDAYGLGDQVNAKALVTQVLQGGISNPKSLANTLPNPAWRAFAAAFNFSNGGASVSSQAAISATTNDYVEQQLESDQGQQDVGVQLALYFERVAPTVTNAYGILGDPNLLQVVQTIFGLPPESSSTNIDQEAATISKLMPLSDLQDPTKLKQLTERFTAMYDLDYGPESGSTNTLTVSGNSSSTETSAASTILGGVISSNGAAIASALQNSGSSTTPLFSNSLLTSLQNFHLGG
jgi:hypothetical protein